MRLRPPRASGVRAFMVICCGQFFSFLGSNLSSFATGVWVYQTTGSATKFALITFFITLPGVLFAPLAGTLVDRWDRRWAMIFADSADAVTKVVLAVLVWKGSLEVWHLYALLPFGSVFRAVQAPAFAAATPLLVGKRHLVRASGAVQAITATSLILAPLLAGILFEPVGLLGLILIDCATVLVGVSTLFFVRIPAVVPAGGERGERGSLLHAMAEGWHYVRRRVGLVHLLLLIAGLNVSFGTVQTLLTPMVLSFSTAAMLGIVLSSASAGMLAGSLLISVWGGPERKVRAILFFLGLQALFLIGGALRPDVALLSVAAFGFMFFMPIIAGCNQAIWQSKVPLELQGRAHSIRSMVSSICFPLAVLVAGPLADQIFEPAMRSGGALARTALGDWLGTGPGRGIAVIFLVMAGVLLLVTFIASRSARLRRLETELPDALPDVSENEDSKEPRSAPGKVSLQDEPRGARAS